MIASSAPVALDTSGVGFDEVGFGLDFEDVDEDVDFEDVDLEDVGLAFVATDFGGVDFASPATAPAGRTSASPASSRRIGFIY